MCYYRPDSNSLTISIVAFTLPILLVQLMYCFCISSRILRNLSRSVSLISLMALLIRFLELVCVVGGLGVLGVLLVWKKR